MAPLWNAHPCCLNVCQLPSAWAETVLVQSLRESAQWVFELKTKTKHSQLTCQQLFWIYMEWIIQAPTHLFPLSTVHAKYSSDPDRKNLSLFSGSRKHGHTFPLHVLEVQILYILVQYPTYSTQQIHETPNVVGNCIWKYCFIKKNPHCHLLYWNLSQ